MARDEYYPFKSIWDEIKFDHMNYNAGRDFENRYGIVEEYDEDTGNPAKLREIGPRPMLPFWVYLITVNVKDIVRWQWKLMMCRILDHQWKDISYAGPDSGNMHIYCKRCGEDHCTTLY